jgi:hypothetical protein
MKCVRNFPQYFQLMSEYVVINYDSVGSSLPIYSSQLSSYISRCYIPSAAETASLSNAGI